VSQQLNKKKKQTRQEMSAILTVLAGATGLGRVLAGKERFSIMARRTAVATAVGSGIGFIGSTAWQIADPNEKEAYEMVFGFTGIGAFAAGSATFLTHLAASIVRW